VCHPAAEVLERMTRPRLAAKRSCALGLVGAILILTALVGVHELEHLRGSLNSRICPLCQWNTSASASVAAAVVSFTACLALLGQCPGAAPEFSPALSQPARPSRAPPVLA
jgi:hypothetical protein